jgi:glycerol kinase
MPPTAPVDSRSLFLALDQGGSSSRAVLFDALGQEVAAARVPIDTQRAAGDRVEHDPDELVRSLQVAGQKACDSDEARGRPVIAAGLATQRSTIVCWDRDSGRPLSAAISWQDRRNAAWLHQQLGSRGDWVRTITGLPLSPHYGASKIRWCLDHLPTVRAAADAGTLAAGPLSSFLAFRLLEERPLVADPANASRTLLYDPDALDWSPLLLDAFSMSPRILPRSVGTRHAFGTMRIGDRRIPLGACTGDQSAAAFAFGQPVATSALVNVGTGAFVQRLADRGSELPNGLLRSVLRSVGTDVIYSHEGTVNGAGSAVDWLHGRVALDLDRAMQRLPIDGPREDPPLFINGVGGLGAPYWRPDFPVKFVGNGTETLLLTAVIESIAFLLQVNVAAMNASAPLSRVAISGGLSNCDYLCQSLADLSGCVVERHALREATARGVAFLAAGEPRHWPPVPVDRRFTTAGNPVLHARFARWRGEMERRGATN